MSGMFPTIHCSVTYYGFADFKIMKQCLSNGDSESEIFSVSQKVRKHS
ncbi:MAG: hypothetical protein PUC65_10250 [Clostridiales bacterium]|nr:hypothetical protein [Clostridiales bacterium]